MQQVEGTRMTLEDKRYLEQEIKELKRKIDENNALQDKLFGRENRQLEPEVFEWTKKLRRLRRLRNIND